MSLTLPATVPGPASSRVLWDRFSCPLPRLSPHQEQAAGTEAGAALLGKLHKPRLVQGRAVMSRAGHRASSPGSELYFTSTANYLCDFNLRLVSCGEKRPQACFHDILFSLTRVTWHSASPQQRRVPGPFSAGVRSRRPPQPAQEAAGLTAQVVLPTHTSKGAAWAQTQGRRGLLSEDRDLCSFLRAGGPGHRLPEGQEMPGAATLT